MEANQILQLATPAFFVILAIELLVTRAQRRRLFRLNDTLTNLAVAVHQQFVEALLASATFAAYLWLYERHRLLDLRMSSPLVWGACLLAQDFFFYWFHRWSHTVNLMWATHVPHHSSEEFNTSVALRQAAYGGLFAWAFYLPLALAGFPPVMFLVVSQGSALYQFWIHTQTVGRLGPLEWVLNTPSHHRVHHGRNPRYLDRNFAGALIVWDRLFGTFEPETEEVVFGTVEPVHSFNPVWINLHYVAELAELARAAPRFGDKLRVWLAHPAWRPEGVEPLPPPPAVTRATARKFDPALPAGLAAYVVVQFIGFTAAALAFIFLHGRLAPLPVAALVAFLVSTMACLGGLLEGSAWAPRAEWVRLAVVWGAGEVLAFTVGSAALALAPLLVLPLALWLRRALRPAAAVPSG